MPTMRLADDDRLAGPWAHWHISTTLQRADETIDRAAVEASQYGEVSVVRFDAPAGEHYRDVWVRHQ